MRYNNNIADSTLVNDNAVCCVTSYIDVHKWVGDVLVDIDFRLLFQK